MYQESSWSPGPERRQEDSGTSKDVSPPGIKPGSQDLASCAITASPPQHDTTGPRHRAFDVFQGSCYSRTVNRPFLNTVETAGMRQQGEDDFPFHMFLVQGKRQWLRRTFRPLGFISVKLTLMKPKGEPFVSNTVSFLVLIIVLSKSTRVHMF